MPQAPQPAELLIVGGGAAGLLAAIGSGGRRTVILEKNDSIGRKLLATGNGRCNLSHRPIATAAYFGQADFIERFVARWPTDALLDILDQCGISCVEEEGRLYPRGGRADGVSRLLEAKARSLGTEFVTRAAVTTLTAGNDGITATCADGRAWLTSRCIVAAGGAAAPVYGTTGDAYAWLRTLGHTVAPPRPALTPLLAGQPQRWGRAHGQKAHVRASLRCDGENLLELTDEMLFLKTGFSGPLAMNLSAAYRLQGTHALHIDFLPEWDAAEVRQRLTASTMPLGVALLGWLPGPLAEALLTAAGDAARRTWQELTDGQQQAVLAVLKDTVEPVAGTDTFAAAKVTAGGVLTAEIDDDYQSRLVPGLYLAGEVLDVHGLSGGHNLHFAFASGYQAGAAAAR